MYAIFSRLKALNVKENTSPLRPEHSSNQYQVITWANTDFIWTGPQRTTFDEILIKITVFIHKHAYKNVSFIKMHTKMLYARMSAT